ncbi:MAG TPA: DUF1553 domain-containing protein [Prosthecobacter sp.]|nr:DUF1553 domain-containing protein [Prosthecobacter sp.]
MPLFRQASTLTSRCLPVAAVLAASALTGAARAVDFNREIRPILSQHCFSCHGFDETTRKAGLRLDTPQGATTPAKSGQRAVVPGAAAKSELFVRITTHDPDDLMPPAKHEKPLSQHQIDLLQQWINEGAPYARHWAFELPRKPPPPAAAQPGWERNAVDAFVLHQLGVEKLHPSPEADKATLLRRVTLDLTGIPPSLPELDAFLSDTSPLAFERAVDRLLASPRFGERMAVDWLDAARYADTNGYFGDKTRSAWPWRQWVIEAFNRNLSFDQFTVAQLAGDLLPGPTRDQLIATGFHRNSMANNESGIIDEEYRVETIVDRIDTTATTWMGLTIGCAQCHDHKFDPISQKDYYQLFAFFNNTPEKGLIKDESPPPVISVPSPAQTAELLRLKQALASAEAAFAPFSGRLKEEISRWEKAASPDIANPVTDVPLVAFDFEAGPKNSSFREIGEGSLLYQKGILGMGARFDATKHLEGPRNLPLAHDRPWTIALWAKTSESLAGLLSKSEANDQRRGIEIIWQKGRLLIHLTHRWGVDAIEVLTREPLGKKSWIHLALSYDGSGKAAGLRLFANGEDVPLQVNRDTLSGTLINAAPLLLGRRDSGLGYYGELDEFRVIGRAISQSEANRWFWSERLRGILSTPAKDRSAAEVKVLADYYVDRHAQADLRLPYQEVAKAKTRLADMSATIPTALVMQELPKPRKTQILMRGVYDQPGDAVTADIPAALGPLPADMPRNRLGLARWLVSPENPLTARVIANRLWQQCFGEGLVRTVNDFGAQGELPTHPELLDWLAVEFMSSGWDVKHLLRQIVTSATYRQSSRASPQLLNRDPENRLLARGPRFRLPAEMLRDQALAVSGLLENQLGGPSVKPFQPPGLWEAVSYNGDESYIPDTGAGLWRRSLYTFWKRQAPPPATLAFDGPTREKCTIRRARTNTPLQALVLLNDETYIATAAALATAALASVPDEPGRIHHIFRRITSRLPQGDETAVLQTLLDQQRYRFSSDPSAARQVSGTGPEHAAWTVLAHTLLNLDEAITRR